MTAPCLVRLDRAIAETADELARARLLAEKACYLARIGEYASAEAIRGELRQGFGEARDLKVSVLVMLLEGLQSYYRCLGGDARDRLMRAQLLSKAAQHRELTAITSAWLGHVQFNQGDIAEAIGNIQLAAEMVEVGQWAALGRISSVLGGVFMTVGNLAAARRWYGHARYAAVRYGDQATIGAVTYNQAAFRVFDLRMKSALGLPIDLAGLHLADAEIRSACNYQVAAGVTSLGHLLTSVRVGVGMLFERHEHALELLAGLLRAGEIPEEYPYRTVLQADAVLCCAILGRSAEAQHHLAALLASDLENLPLDDRIIVFATLNRACRHAPEVFDGHYVPVNLHGLGQRLSDERATLAPLLGPFNEIPQILRWQTNEH